MKSNIYRDGKVHIQRAMCPTCIFRPGSFISEERRQGMMDEGACIVCHETLDTTEHAACRGHLDAGCSILQVAVRLDCVEWVRNVWEKP